MKTEAKIQCYKMTFEAIQSVRKELAQCNQNDTREMSETMLRLASLYESIDALRFVECMVELEQNNSNILKVNFSKAA